MTKSTVGTDLLQALEIITKFGVYTVRENLAVLAIDNVLLPVQEPRRDFVLRRVLDERSSAPSTLAAGGRGGVGGGGAKMKVVRLTTLTRN